MTMKNRDTDRQSRKTARGYFLEYAMLIEFSVKNFRSIKDTQTLSMLASADKELPDNTFPLAPSGTSVKRWKNARLLKSAVIYGANASGKSNLLGALRYLCGQMGKKSTLSIHNRYSQKAEAFQLDAEWKDAPSEFRIAFTIDNDGVVYEYYVKISIWEDIVLEEKLDFYPKGRQKCLFLRTTNADFNYLTTIIFPGNSLKGVRGLKEQTAPDTLFLSVAAAFNQPLLGKIRSWFSETKATSESGSRKYISDDQHTVLENNPLLKKRMNSWLYVADLGIKDFKSVEKESLLGHFASGNEKREVGKNTYKEFAFLHKGISEEFIGYFQESSGTQRWVDLFLDAYKTIAKGSLIFIDEISADLHPLLAAYFMALFHHPRFNPNNAQLICTTHHSSLLSADVLRRDQIWFAEKDEEGASHYYSLLDYSPRKDKALMKGYLSGEYGAVPNLAAIDDLLDHMGL